MKAIEEIEEVLRRASIDGALTREASDYFHDVLKKNDELVEANASQTKQLSSVRDDLGKANTALGIANALVKVAAEAELKMIEREARITTLELTAKHQTERVKDHKEMFTTVFRNSVLRREVMTPTTPYVDQYGNKTDTYPSKDKVEEEET